MTYFHAVPNAAFVWSHIQSPLKLVCSAGLEKRLLPLLICGMVVGNIRELEQKSVGNSSEKRKQERSLMVTHTRRGRVNEHSSVRK